MTGLSSAAAGCGCLLLTSTLAFINLPSTCGAASTPGWIPSPAVAAGSWGWRGAEPAAASARAAGARRGGGGGGWWAPASEERRPGQWPHQRGLLGFWGRPAQAGLAPAATGSSSSSSGSSNPQGFRPVRPEDFAQNHQPVDRSGNPEKRAAIAAVLPGVDLDKLCKEVPDALLWSDKELRARLSVLAEAMPGHDPVAAVSDSPTILVGAPYLKKALEQFAEWFPGKALPELLPRYPDSSLGTAPRSLTYPARLDWELPYLDPGLMGNYSVQGDLVDAMRRSQHLVFGLWEEDEQALERFANATRRAVLAFETRVFFLRDYYAPEHFERYYADDLFGETVGFVEDWAKKHPPYEAHLDEKLTGYQGLETFRLKRLPVAEKEELMIQARAEGVLGPDGAFLGPRAALLPVGVGAGAGAEDEEEDDGWDDLDDGADELAQGKPQAGGGAGTELDEFALAMRQALWVFEARVGFLERYYGTETYRNDVIRRARAETAGNAEEFVERYPEYEAHLHEVLDGWQRVTAPEWEQVHIDAKEDQLVALLQARGRAMVTVQRQMMGVRAEPVPAVMRERAAGASREEARARLAAEEEARLESLSDEEVKRHWAAYESYVKQRFPQLRADIDAMNAVGEDFWLESSEEDEEAFYGEDVEAWDEEEE